MLVFDYRPPFIVCVTRISTFSLESVRVMPKPKRSGRKKNFCTFESLFANGKHMSEQCHHLASMAWPAWAGENIIDALWRVMKIDHI